MYEEPVTKELKIIESQSYSPLDRDKSWDMRFKLSEQQVTFIDKLAKKHDISFERALQIAWNDAIEALIKNVHMAAKYPSSICKIRG